MYFYWGFLYLCFLTLSIPCAGSSYNVAVVEYGPNLDKNLTSDERLAANVENYLNIIKETTRKNNQTLDLIVFPEATLMYHNNLPETAALLPSSTDLVLCNSSDKNYATFLKVFSCAAISYKTTIIINFTEKVVPEENSTNCKSDVVFFNTNIAIGSNGTIIARYRKWNLFGEYGKSKPSTLDLPVLEVKNTSFGMLTCFDIQFGIPAINLTTQIGVRNIIFPLNWIAELPYLTALQVQQMWSQEFNVVLLAAGASVPEAGAGGSGIFFGNQGSLESDILDKHGTKVMFHNIPTDLQIPHTHNISNETDESIDILASSMDDFFMLVDPSIADHSSLVLNTTQENINTRICHGKEKNGICCDFNVSLSMNYNVKDKDSTYYTYHLVAFNGIRTYSNLYYGGVETCGLVACLNSSLASCGQRFNNYSKIVWPISFKSINITGFFAPSDQRVQFATTLLSSIRPLPLNTILWEKDVTNSTVIRKLTLKKSVTRLLTFGIFGRDFGRDWDPIRNESSDNYCSKSSINKEIDLIFFSLLILNVFALSRF